MMWYLYLASCTMGTGFFLGLKSGRGVRLPPYPLLVPWSWKGRTIPLLSLWAERPVQSLYTGGPYLLPFLWYLLCLWTNYNMGASEWLCWGVTASECLLVSDCVTAVVSVCASEWLCLWLCLWVTVWLC